MPQWKILTSEYSFQLMVKHSMKIYMNTINLHILIENKCTFIS